MEVMMIFPLLLLICSLSTAELQTAQLSNNEIIPQGEQTESQGRAANTFDPQHTGPGDIHAVLREMSALLAEQKVEIRHLQREIEAQAAQLRDLELQKSGLEKLKQQVQVAFSASLLASGSGTTGPFNTHTPLAFRYVLTNIGNAYNPNSGFFIAPVRGVYRFEFYISAYGNPSHATAAILVKNGQHIFSAYERQDSRYVSTANAATLLLESGDVMFLSLWAHCRIYDDESHLSTFSGHLLFTV